MRKEKLNNPEKAKCEIVRLRQGVMLLDAMPPMSNGLLRKLLGMLVIVVGVMLTACEKPITPIDDGNARLTFTTTNSDITTRGDVYIGDYFSKLNVQLFDADGNKVFDKVKSQSKDDDNFGTLSCSLQEGTYTVVAVGHSSPTAATIKSTEMVQFTAKNGVKNTDTFCFFGQIVIDEDHADHELRMNRMTAMLRFVFTDEEMPESFAGIKCDYSGGSANFNPSTSEGCTKSNQSELRGKSGQYVFFTFPYMATEGTLKVTLHALDADQNVLTTKVITDVPVTRNRISTYTGTLFTDEPGTITQTSFGITVNADWDGEDFYYF